MYLTQQYNDLNIFIRSWLKSLFPTEDYIKGWDFNWSTIQLDQHELLSQIEEQREPFQHNGHGLPYIIVNLSNNNTQMSNDNKVHKQIKHDANTYLTDNLVNISLNGKQIMTIDAIYKELETDATINILFKDVKEAMAFNEIILSEYSLNFKTIPCGSENQKYTSFIEVGSLLQRMITPQSFDYIIQSITTKPISQLQVTPNHLDNGNNIISSPFDVYPLIQIKSTNVNYTKKELQSHLQIELTITHQLINKLHYSEDGIIKEIVFVIPS